MQPGQIAIFTPRKERVDRFGKHTGLPVEIRLLKQDGTILVFANDGENRFSAYPDELNLLKKPIHGSPKNYSFDNEGNLK